MIVCYKIFRTCLVILSYHTAEVNNWGDLDLLGKLKFSDKLADSQNPNATKYHLIRNLETYVPFLAKGRNLKVAMSYFKTLNQSLEFIKLLIHRNCKPLKQTICCTILLVFDHAKNDHQEKHTKPFLIQLFSFCQNEAQFWKVTRTLKTIFRQILEEQNKFMHNNVKFHAYQLNSVPKSDEPK